VVIETIARVGGVIEIGARAGGSTAACPGCGEPSRRVHSRYGRSLADAAIGGQPVRIRLRVRRFACARTDCARKTFVEQVEDLTLRYGRHSQLLRAMLESIGLALAGRAGARLTRRLAVPVSRMTLLRLVRAMPDPVVGEVSAVGIDDFALRRGHVYGTVVIDSESHRALDVLPDRTADTVADWLTQHPDLQVVCRDRAGAYAEAARVGAPQAVQVADRWHLWHNLCEAVDKIVSAHRSELRADPPEQCDDMPDDQTPDDQTPDDQMANDDKANDDKANDDKAEEEVAEDDMAKEEVGLDDVAPDRPASPSDAVVVEGALVVRTRERYAAVQALRAQGRSITAISRELGLDRHTARRFVRAEHLEDLLVKAQSRDSVLDAFKPYLHERFNAGHTDAAALTAEITALGYRGSDKTVRRYLQPFRASLTAPAPVPVGPSVRQVTGWLTRRPDTLNEDERLELKKILDRSTALTVTSVQVREFAEMLTKRQGQRLGDWMRDVQDNGAPALRSFANGLRNDLDAVTAGLTLDYSSGAVEGTVNRIKMLKRQMFGRAKFDLLRKRILHPV
jgi:transposase